MTTQHAIDATIEELQRSLEATRVPGELSDWLTPVRNSLTLVRRVLSGESLPRHRRDLAQIASDVTLLPKVEQLRAEDAELLADVLRAENLAAKAAVLLEQSNGQEEDITSLEELSETAQSIVIRLRTQEQAIDTWFLESLNRDEGVSG